MTTCTFCDGPIGKLPCGKDGCLRWHSESCSDCREAERIEALAQEALASADVEAHRSVA